TVPTARRRTRRRPGPTASAPTVARAWTRPPRARPGADGRTGEGTAAPPAGRRRHNGGDGRRTREPQPRRPARDRPRRRAGRGARRARRGAGPARGRAAGRGGRRRPALAAVPRRLGAARPTQRRRRRAVRVQPGQLPPRPRPAPGQRLAGVGLRALAPPAEPRVPAGARRAAGGGRGHRRGGRGGPERAVPPSVRPRLAAGGPLTGPRARPARLSPSSTARSVAAKASGSPVWPYSPPRKPAWSPGNTTGLVPRRSA